MIKRRLSAVISILSLLAATPAEAQTQKVTAPWYSLGRISGGVAGSTTSGATAVALPGSNAPVAWACNTGANDAYIAFGGASVSVSATTGSWLKSGQCTAYDLNPQGTYFDHVAVVTASSTTTVALETGIGMPPVWHQ